MNNSYEGLAKIDYKIKIVCDLVADEFVGSVLSYLEPALPIGDELFPLKLSSDDSKCWSKCASKVAVSSKNEL